VAAAFDLSYQRLTPPQQRVLRLLSLTPGADIDPYAAAALTGMPVDAVRGHLRALRTHRLIEKPAHDRYRLHDLIAVYLRARTAAEERGQALERLLDYYQHAAAAAASGISRYNARPPRARAPDPEPATPDLSSQARAMRWLRAERANLLACLQHTRRCRQHARLVDLTASLGVFLDQDGPPAERIELRAHALSVCRETGDRAGEAWTLSELGAFENMTSYLQAAGLQEQALTIFRELGDRAGEVFALLELGDLLMDAGDYPQGASLQEQALTISRETGNRYGEVRALNQLGDKYRTTGDYPRARDLQEQALTFRREIGNRDGEAEILNHQGALLFASGDPAKARERHLRALELARGAGNPLEEARALAGTGSCAVAMRIAGGPADLREALEIFRRIGAAEAVDLTAAGDLHPSHTASGWTPAEN